VHDGRIVAFDAHGNRSAVMFIYRDSVEVALEDDAGERRSSMANVRWRDSHLAVDLHGAYFHGAFAVVPVRDPRHLLTERGHGDDVVRFDTVGVRAADLADTVRPLERAHDSDTATVWLAAVRAVGAGTVRFAPLDLTVTHPDGSLFGDAVVYAVKEGAARAPRQRSLSPRSPAIRFGPTGLLLKQNVTVRLEVARPTAQDAVYRSADAAGPWSFLASTVDSAGVVAPIDRPGVFAVLRDATAPWIGTARVVVATSYADGASTHEVHIPVDDEGSGFDEGRTEVFVGGVKRIWRWDFVAKKIIVALRDEPIIGPQPVRVVAFDRIGNSSKADATVTVETRASH
jgi:hypothetical protein